jgi:hypothetical protein
MLIPDLLRTLCGLLDAKIGSGNRISCHDEKLKPQTYGWPKTDLEKDVNGVRIYISSFNL